jgi:hypothetical protein
VTGIRSAWCGSAEGVRQHKLAGEDPCWFCAQATPPGASEDQPEWRYYDAGGALIGTDAPNDALLALLGAGDAREVSGTELADWGV